MAAVLDAGADMIVRAGWRKAGWLDAEGEPIDLLAEFCAGTASGLIDQPIWLARKSGLPSLRLIAAMTFPDHRNADGDGLAVGVQSLPGRVPACHAS